MSSEADRMSRWEAPSSIKSSVTTTTVSDDDAVKALLAEAAAEVQARREQRVELSQQQIRKRARTDGERSDPANDYYGPGGNRASVERGNEASQENQEGGVVERMKPDFGLSGALAADSSGRGSNLYKGVLLKFQEPPEARTPNTKWRLYVFKGDEQIDTLHVSMQSAYLWGRNLEIADISLQHPSCSSQHAVLQYRALPHKETGKASCQPYLLDLESTNGSFINGVRIDAARYYQLKKGDVLKFGSSTREYVILAG